jgi:PAS domain S-box-containing protein
MWEGGGKQLHKYLMNVAIPLAILRLVDVENLLNHRKKIYESYSRRSPLSTDAIYVIFDRKLEYVNKVFEGLFGYTADEVYRPEFELMSLFAQESRKSVQKIFDEGVRGHRGVHQFEFIGRRKDGGTFACDTSAIFIPYKWGMATNGMMWDASHTEKHQQIIVKKDGIEMAVGF